MDGRARASLGSCTRGSCCHGGGCRRHGRHIHHALAHDSCPTACRQQPLLVCAPPLLPCRIVVVGRSTCPFCIEVTRTLADMGLAFPYFLVDKVRQLTLQPVRWQCAWINAAAASAVRACRCPTATCPLVVPLTRAWLHALADALRRRAARGAEGGHRPEDRAVSALTTSGRNFGWQPGRVTDALLTSIGHETAQPHCSFPPRPACSYVYANGKLLGGCDATKALIASGTPLASTGPAHPHVCWQAAGRVSAARTRAGTDWLDIMRAFRPHSFVWGCRRV